MKIEIKNHKGTALAEVISDDIVISDVQDAIDLLGNCDYQGARKIIYMRKI